ncbi:MAG: hypothetical protein HY736_07285, partial [Verrucomicrobia bacterium]|nr:hypothetical protein [Verrucomicrobiota bacterium]
MNDVTLNQRLGVLWGEVRESPLAKRQLAAKYKAQLSSAVLARADKSQGRLVFNNTCAA